MGKKLNKNLIISSITLVFVIGITLTISSIFFSMHNHNMGENNNLNNMGDGFMNHAEMLKDSNSNNMNHNEINNNLNSKVIPTSPGQDAFGAIGEIVNMLNNDKNTNWEKVNITALKEHLIDMDVLITKTNVIETKIQDGLIMNITSKDQRTVEAIQRMVKAHSEMILSQTWNSKVDLTSNGAILRVIDKNDFVKIQHLGFYGIMAWGGNHHQVHHLALAKGEVIFK